MLVNDVYTYLTTQIGATYPVIIGTPPNDTSNVIALISLDGADNTTYFGTTKSLNTPLVKCVIRNESYATGATWVDLLYTTLHKASINTYVVGSGGMYLGRDSAGLHCFQITFKILKEE